MTKTKMIMTKYKVLYFGTWGYGKAGLEGLLKSKKVEVLEVFTKWDPNHNNAYMDQVKELSISNNIPVKNTLRSICSKEEFKNSIFENNDVDFLLSCCFDRKFSNEILRLPKFQSLNIHPSILPKYRGIKPLENAIINDEDFTGITIHVLEEELDAGNIVLQYDNIKINHEHTFEELYNRQCHAITKITEEFFQDPIENLSNKYSQEETKVTYAPRLGFNINDDMTVSDIINMNNKLTN